MHVVLEDIKNFKWLKVDVKKVLKLWYAGYSILFISDRVKRTTDEIALLIMDLGDSFDGLVPLRSNGMFKSTPQYLPKGFDQKFGASLKDFETYYEMFTVFKINFAWEGFEVRKLIEMAERGVGLNNLSLHFNRTVLETALLIFDCGRRGLLEGEYNGFYQSNIARTAANHPA